MGLGRVMDGLYQFCVWVMRLSYLNILWIVFTLLGLVVGGFAPSTLAMFSVLRKWVMEKKEIKVFPLFWKSYREEFVRSNIIFAILALIGWVLYLDVQILKHVGGMVYTISVVIIVSLTIIFSLISLVIFPVLSHYQFKTLEYFKYTFLIVLSSPIKMVLMVLGIGLIVLGFLAMPSMAIFFSGSLFSLIIMYFTSTIFKRIDGLEVDASVQ